MKHPDTNDPKAESNPLASTGSAYFDELQLMEEYRRISQNPAYDAFTRGAASTRYQMIKRLHARRPKAF